MNTPTIHTERLILRRFTLDDALGLYDLINDPETNHFLPILPFNNIEEAKSFIQENYLDKYEREIGFRYAITLKETNEFIGYIIASNSEPYDFGYALSRQYWSNGYVTEAGSAIINKLKESEFKYITATHDVNNHKSGNVMKRLGMTYKYSYTESVQPKNMLVTFRMYQLNFDDCVDTYNGYKDKFNSFIEDIK